MQLVPRLHRSPRATQGFTLLELMIVVAIIGVLAAIAVPQYQSYVMRSKWRDTIQAAADLKLAMSECFQQSGEINAVPAVCASMSDLFNNGYLSYSSPISTKYGAQVSISIYLPSLMLGATIPASAQMTGANAGSIAVIVLASTNDQLGRCTLLLVPVPSGGKIDWLYAYPQGSTSCIRATGIHFGN